MLMQAADSQQPIDRVVVCNDCMRRSGPGDEAPFQHDDLIGEIERALDTLFDEQDGHAAGSGEFREGFHQFLADDRREAFERFEPTCPMKRGALHRIDILRRARF